MRRIAWVVVIAGGILGAAAACARSTPVTQPPPRDRLYASLVGKWQGELEYKDYRDSTRRVKLPTIVQIVPAPDEDGLELRYTYDDGPGKTVKSVDHLHFDRPMLLARWGGVQDSTLQRFSVHERAGGVNGQPLRLVLEADATDDDKPARIRETFEITTGVFVLRKDTAINGSALSFRHEYRLRRAE